MKAYQVHDADHETGCIVFAENVGKAKQMGASELSRDFIDVRAQRVKKYDQYAETKGGVPVGVMLKDGWWFTCGFGRCGNQVREEDLKDGAEIIGNKAICAECAKKLKEGES